MFGDILSDIAVIHGGGLGLASSANLGKTHALFEPVHGAAPDIAGRGIANPLAAIGCVALLLEWAEHRGLLPERRSLHVRAAVAETAQMGPHPPDTGGTASTAEVTAAVLSRLMA
jgi:homoisocitrate dehydrogenase